jgi:micrococcal nuclease
MDVVDGDTIDVLMGGWGYPVRYIGVDTPETVHPTIGVEPFGKEASNRNRELVEGRTVYLEKDVSETDKYGRLLRYVWLADGRMVNEVLVAEGYAQVSTYPPDVKYADRFLAAQQKAVAAGLGLWGDTHNEVPLQELVSTPSLPKTPASSGTPSAGCHPSYPNVCIPPPPPDLDCADMPYRGFRVLPPDPHGFDGDNDGIGCER